MLWTHEAQQVLTTVMTHVVVDKSTDNAKPNSICFLPQYQHKKSVYFSARELKKALRDKLTCAASSGLLSTKAIRLRDY